MRDDTGNKPEGAKSAKKPEWANGLRQLYDSVVDEPLPDSFQDLLSKLDNPDSNS
ncbi:MAG: NepR family anti-sigma factor [Pontixanthobacter sp.]